MSRMFPNHRFGSWRSLYNYLAAIALLPAVVALAGCGTPEETPVEPVANQSGGSSAPESGVSPPLGGVDLQGQFAVNTGEDHAEKIRQELEKRRQSVDENEELERYARHLVQAAERDERLGYFETAQNAREEVLQISKRLHGENSWQAKSATVDLTYHHWLAKLPAEEHEKLKEAITVERQAVKHHGRGEYREAEEKTIEVLRTWHAAGGTEQIHYAFLLSFLAGQYQRQGDYQRAAARHEDAVKLFAKLLGENHPDYAAALDSLAVMHQDQGNFRVAEGYFRQASEIRRVAFGEDHVAYAMGLNNLASLYQEMRDFDSAQKYFTAALDLFKAKLGTDSPYYASGLKNLAVLALERGDLPQAESLIHQAIDIFKKALGGQHATHPNYAICLREQGRIEHQKGELKSAERLLTEALTILRGSAGFDHPSYAKTQLHLGEVYLDLKNYPAAEPLLADSLKSREKMFGPQHPDVLKNLTAYARLLRGTGREAEAAKYEARARSLQARAPAAGAIQ